MGKKRKNKRFTGYILGTKSELVPMKVRYKLLKEPAGHIEMELGADINIEFTADRVIIYENNRPIIVQKVDKKFDSLDHFSIDFTMAPTNVPTPQADDH